MQARRFNRRRLIASSLLAAGAGAAALAAERAKVALVPARLSGGERLDIQDVFARYAWSYDCTDEAGYLDCFTDDAIIVGANPGQTYRGKEAIRGWFQYLINLREKEGDDWLHDAYHHRFFGDRRHCIVYSYATHFSSNQPLQRRAVRSTGYFVSECVPRHGEWLMRRHSVNPWDRRTLPWNKPLPWAALGE
jgi:ketosteroid isomerase-like protein